MVMNDEEKILLVKNYYRGWEFPGGYVNLGESIIEAAVREVKEESGVNINIIKLLGIEQDYEKSTCVVVLKGRAVSGKLVHSDESEGVEYFTFDEALKRIKLERFKERLIRCVKEKDLPFLIE